jgi:hypothetical protein
MPFACRAGVSGIQHGRRGGAPLPSQGVLAVPLPCPCRRALSGCVTPARCPALPPCCPCGVGRAVGPCAHGRAASRSFGIRRSPWRFGLFGLLAVARQPLHRLPGRTRQPSLQAVPSPGPGQGTRPPLLMRCPCRSGRCIGATPCRSASGCVPYPAGKVPGDGRQAGGRTYNHLSTVARAVRPPSTGLLVGSFMRAPRCRIRLGRPAPRAGSARTYCGPDRQQQRAAVPQVGGQVRR